MEASVIREAAHAQPFQPFRLRLADGREVLIPHPDFIAVSPNGRRVIVFHSDESMSILEPLLIVSVEVPAPDQQGGKSNGLAGGKDQDGAS
jgi:hypothetical protein